MATEEASNKQVDNLAANVPLIINALNSLEYGDLVIRKHAGRIVKIERNESIPVAK